MDAQIIIPKTTLDLVKESEPDSFYFRTLEAQGILLNEQQLEGVRNLSTRLLIVAGAGSGKTLCIIAKVGYLLSVMKVNPENVLVITYTRKAAEELRTRLHDIVGKNNINACTVHSLCYRILLANGYRKHKLITNDRQKVGIMKEILKNHIDLKDMTPAAILQAYSYVKSTCNSLPEEHKAISKVFSEYDAYKREHKLYDFDDFLTLSLELLEFNPILSSLLQTQYKYILVDEFQDINPVQYKIIQILGTQNSLHIVGDSRQAIYSFRGSDSGIILGFGKEHSNSHTISLNINYRSSSSVLGLANNIIRTHQSTLYDDLLAVKPGLVKPTLIEQDNTIDEAKFIADHIVEAVKKGNRKHHDFSVLYRTGRSASAVIDEFTLRELPFKVYGNIELLYEDATAKLILDHLRLSQNPDDIVAIAGILPSLYLNRSYTLQLLGRQGPNKLLSLLTIHTLKDYQTELIENRIDLILNISDSTPLQAIKILKENCKLRKYMGLSDINNSIQAEIIQETLNELEASASRFQTIEQYINFVGDVIKKNKQQKDDSNVDAVVLSSIHSAKGLQFPVVFLVGVVEGTIPHKYATSGNDRSIINLIETSANDIEEENRILYVGVTRASEELILSSPKIMANGYPAETSRFIQPLIKSKN